MKIERIRLKNFRALHDVDLKDIPPFAVFTGANGSGKSTLFQVFGFLKDALQHNVTVALQKIGGYQEAATRGHENEPILIEIQFRMLIAGIERLVTYSLEIAKNKKDNPFVKREVLRYERDSSDSPFHSIDFKKGIGTVIFNEEDFNETKENLNTEKQVLGSDDILAIKGLGQFKRFRAANAFRSLIENWHVSDFHIMAARQRAEMGLAEHLSETGDNLPLVVKHLYDNDRKTFNHILKEFQNKIPGVSEVIPRVTEDGHVLLRFKDGNFKDPFIARYVSDGTIKIFAYLVLLHDPKPHPFLCIEEPENQLYPKLFPTLVDELRDYARRGGQVFVSTHSPDLMGHVKLEEAFLLKKTKGLTTVRSLIDNEQIKALIDGGDNLSSLWGEGLIEGLEESYQHG